MASDIRVLFVEDSADDAELLLRELGRGGFKCASLRVDTPEALKEALKDGAWDIIIADYSMPRLDGIEALRIVKRICDLPFIVVSGAIGEETAVEAMKAGAHDYIMKGNLSRLVPAVTRELKEAAVRSLQKRMADEAGLIQARLIQANKMTSLGTLAAGVAHEINNPNNFIMFNATLLAGAWQDALKVLAQYYRENGDFLLGGIPFSEMNRTVPDLLSGIVDGSRRIKNIVDNLKNFARTEAPELLEEVDVNGAVGAAVSMLGSHIKNHTVNFNVSLGAELPFVKGSSQRIEQVVVNLVLNSLHALPDKERGVWVTTSYDAAAGSVMIKVRDEGSGMAREVLDHLMEPFFTTKADTGGMGLGLSISYAIIKEHRGVLEFDSAPGKGTTAVITLPALEGHPRK